MLSGKQGEITEAQAESLSIVQRQAERLASLINDLLDVSRIEAGRVPMDQEPVPVDEIAEGALEELRPQAREKGVKLRLNTPTTPCMARGDYQRLTQVFVNLIGNAIKFTPEGGRGAVAVTLQKKDVLIEIADTGVGIPKDEVGRVFDKFYQVRRSAERKTNGTGLGLAIVKGIIEAHGGRIWLHSEEGRGTQFYFTLPTAG